MKDGAEEKGLEERAKALLDRVLLMRVFDFVGVVEAVAEIGAILESKGGGADYGGAQGTEEDGNRDGVEEVEARTSDEIERDENGGEGRLGMIIVDSMTNVASSMMSRDHIQGPSLPLSHPAITLRPVVPSFMSTPPLPPLPTTSHPQATPS